MANEKINEEMNKISELAEIIGLVGQTMDEAEKAGLEIEVISSAIQHIQKNPGMDLSVALQNALTDWDL